MANRQIEAVLRISSKLGSMRALRTLERELKQVERGASRFNRANSVMMVGANRAAASTMRLLAPAAAAYGGARAVKNYGEIERRIGRIGATAEASVADTEKFAQRLRGLATDLRVPFDQVVEGADELAASGKSIDQINALLPSVARAAHASGAEFKDMATTADAVSGSLGIMESQMQRAFDVLAYGGKVGKFELKDMASELPSLLPAFSALGYKGEEGLKKVVAMLQGVRMETGTSSEAATSLMDIFTKMEGLTVTNNFKKFGVDLRKSLAIARREGRDVVDTFMDLAVHAVKGDLSKLPQIFTDKQMLIGMRALINQREQVAAWQRDMSNASGTVANDWKRFSSDTQASLDTLANSFDRLAASAGKSIVSMGGATAMDHISENLDKASAINAALEKQGYSWLQARGWWAANGFDIAAQDGMAWRGGFRTDEQRRMIDAYAAYGDSRNRAAAAQRVTPDRPRDSKGFPIVGPIPEARPTGSVSFDAAFQRQRGQAARRSRRSHADRRGIGSPTTIGSRDAAYDEFMRAAAAGGGQEDALRRNSTAWLFPQADKTMREALAIQTGGTFGGGDPANDVRLAGQDAGRAIEDAARKVNEAGSEAGSAFTNMLQGAAEQFGLAAARTFNANIKPVMAGGGGGVSVNPGVAPVVVP